VTAGRAFSTEELRDRYGKDLDLQFRIVRPPPVRQQGGEVEIALFNLMLRRWVKPYDLLINTSNSLLFLPPRQRVWTYLFYPRKARLMADVRDIHLPESHFSPWSSFGLKRRALRLLYRYSRVRPEHRIVCMTHFTRDALEREYAVESGLPIVYPPVDMGRLREPADQPRRPGVVTLGRFAPDKRQLEQIRIAQQIPDVPFHLAGFAAGSAYYEACHRYVQQHDLRNVHLYPDAPFDTIVGLLQSTTCFLHTLVNEPFGITAVQAMAAGCLPVVHDSGGQRETVVLPEWRYQALEEVPGLIQRLHAMDDTERARVSEKLQEHIQQFDEATFHQRIRELLMPYLRGEA
jgi:glycosyltransferase involved in cell wall biosynthesis